LYPRISPDGLNLAVEIEGSNHGRFLAFDQKDPQTRDDAWFLPFDGKDAARPIAQSRFGEGSAKFSPDGRWIAYPPTNQADRRYTTRRSRALA
jgi:dipeptidyl aminopeptidase/acylaminoacyl peptidase